jgi:hypothetical protein
VFAALYVAAARRHGLGTVRMLAALAAGFAGTLGAVVLLARPVPALPFLGLAVVVAMPRARAIPAAERRAAWPVMIGCGIAGLALLAR